MSNTAVNATAYAVRGQAYRLGVSFFNIATGAVITGWTGGAVTVSTDSGATTSGVLVESPANSGMGYVDLTAAQMTGSMVQFIASISNSSATQVAITQRTLNLTDYAAPTGAWDEQSVVLLEQMIMDIAAVAMNNNILNNNTNTVYTRGGSAKFSGTYTESSDFANRGGLT